MSYRNAADEIVGDKNRAAFMDAAYKSGYMLSPREEAIAVEFFMRGMRHQICGVQKPCFNYFNPPPRKP